MTTPTLTQTLLTDDAETRRQRIVDPLTDVLAPLMAVDALRDDEIAGVRSTRQG
jgi:hypothetical protein